MSASEILSQDELDALLSDMPEGDVVSAADELGAGADADAYDFTSQDRVVRGRLPTLDLVSERLVRNLRATLHELLRRPVDIVAGNVQLLKYSDYAQGLTVPSSIHVLRCRRLGGTFLVVLDAPFVFGAVDAFFGGGGAGARPATEFSPAERHLVGALLERLRADLADAWSVVADLDLEPAGTETNPTLVRVLGPGDLVASIIYAIEIGEASGEIHLTIPHEVLEPIREALDTGVRSDTDEGGWRIALREAVQAATLELTGVLVRQPLRLRDVSALEPGDVIPVELPETVVGAVEGVPVLRARFGTSRGNLALKVIERSEALDAAPAGAMEKLSHE